MNRDFCDLLMEKTHFPPEGKLSLLESFDALKAGCEGDLDGAVKFYYDNHFDTKTTQPLVDHMAERSGLSPYTVWMLLLMNAAQRCKEDFSATGISEEIFFDTFSDLRCKALECKAIHDVWGTFVAFWYPIFYSLDLLKLGRLEYENSPYPQDTPYTFGNITIKKGDPVKNIHIPSSGEPFNTQARIDSYRRAYEFYKDELNGGPLICVCHSWLLYPPYKALLSPQSNTLSFMEDFHIISQDDEKGFGDAWRLFGKEANKPMADWPEDTSMRRAYKDYFLSGGTSGEGFGVLIFDGEKIINKQ